MPILKIEKLTKKYGKTYALNGLDMEVKKGDIYGFVGPNGAGKTTTLRIISGLLKSDGGDLWLDGVRTTKNILKQKSLIGFVPDFFGVYENLSVIEYLEFFAASYGIYGRAGTVRAREVLEMVELSGKEEQAGSQFVELTYRSSAHTSVKAGENIQNNILPVQFLQRE